MDPELKRAFDNVASLIETTSASLHAELSADIRDVGDKVDSLAKTVERNTRMMDGGARQIAAIMTWMRKQDAREAKQEAELKRLRSEVRELRRARASRS